MSVNRFVRNSYLIAVFIFVILFQSCSDTTTPPNRFELLTGQSTGLFFINSPAPSQYFNAFNFMYFYNGGGVAVGDFNNDGLQDLYFTANLAPNKMFLNQGNFKFKDVTRESRMEGIEGWTTGTTVVDINNDGMLDIYVCQIGEYATVRGKNQLYVCQGIENGIPVYKDLASEYGIDFSAFSTQASFFDYDLDGDLDMFLMNYSLHQNGTFGQRWTFIGKQHPTSGDRLLKNEHGKYIDVTIESNIHSMVIGYGLGIATSDIDLDGWPDIYIGNDFHENDYLYINQKDGTFKEVVTEQMMHTSRFSMGVDIGDINNDGLSDIFSLDMHPEDPVILKSSLGEDELGAFNFKLGYGYNYQYARNNLQINNGNGTFTEIGMYANVHASDWSWTPLLFDFDHDGYKDLFISNGIPRRMNDIDYITWREMNEDFKWKAQLDNLAEEDLVALEQMPEIKLPNKFYLNQKNLSFKDIAPQILNNKNTYSNGAAYADFDNDGDLDIVVNNSQDNPFIYKNLTIEQEQEREQNKYLSIVFNGPPNNIDGIGAKVAVFKNKEILVYENYPVRGYQSNVQIGTHVGLGDISELDSIIVIWPDHKFEKLNDLNFNMRLEVKYKNDLPDVDFLKLRLPQEKNIEFSDISDESGIDFKHVENQFVEFKRERLIPQAVSTDGPALAIGDVNCDGSEDVFIGGAKRRTSGIYIQNSNGTFSRKPADLIEADETFEDVDAVFEDIDNDGDLDLAVASGGNEFWADSEFLTQRIYLNDGTGTFNDKLTLPGIYMTASCILPHDFNEDGLVDFFIGGRAVPKNYGIIPNSYLIANKGNGEFENVTGKVSRDLLNIGLVKDGAWSDIDLDGDQDLILATEWDAVKILINTEKIFEVRNVSLDKGWWNFILPYDFDQDGDMDILAGNAGENLKFKPTMEQPLKLYLKDFDNDGQLDQVLTYYVGGREIPFANYKELTKQFKFLEKRYPSSRELASEPLNEIFKNLKEAEVFEVNMLSSVLFENTGELKFIARRLPKEIQFSSLETGSVVKSDENESTKVILGGNFYGANIEMGRSDASYGHILTISRDNDLTAYPLGDLSIKGQIRRIAPIRIKDKTCFLLARNNESIVAIQPLTDESPSLISLVQTASSRYPVSRQ
ncbi:MAG: VCBS repeat-containing protein [Cytophagales bacterium]|nr:VCBS repeat-containing protein [Cytophagales bacterium]